MNTLLNPKGIETTYSNCRRKKLRKGQLLVKLGPYHAEPHEAEKILTKIREYFSLLVRRPSLPFRGDRESFARFPTKVVYSLAYLWRGPQPLHRRCAGGKEEYSGSASKCGSQAKMDIGSVSDESGSCSSAVSAGSGQRKRAAASQLEGSCSKQRGAASCGISAEHEQLPAYQALTTTQRAILRRLTSIMDPEQDSVVITNPLQPQGPIVYVTNAWQDMCGYTTTQAVGQNPRLTQGEGTDPETVKSMRKALTAQQPCRVRIINYRGYNHEPFWNCLSVRANAQRSAAGDACCASEPEGGAAQSISLSRVRGRPPRGTFTAISTQQTAAAWSPWRRLRASSPWLASRPADPSPRSPLSRARAGPSHLL